MWDIDILIDMRILLSSRSWLVFFVIVAVVGVGTVIAHQQSNNNDNLVTTTVERGDVRELVSVSGFIEAKNTAELAFPASGRVTEVFVDEGSVVEAGEVLATLASNELVADRNEAVAALRLAQAQLAETKAGPTIETRAVSDTKITNTEQNLTRVSSEQAEKVTNTRVVLLSSDLEALSDDPQENATPPTITGTYNCLESGEYNIEVYSSSAASGFSYRLTGLGKGSQTAFTEQPAPLDDCGLYIQFTDGNQYENSNWTIAIPNTRGASYVTNLNAYELALEQQNNAIAAAKDSLSLALEEGNEVTADARTEVVSQRQAAIDQAHARIAVIDARMADRSIIAPFSGIVTNVNVLPGETVTSLPVITLLAEDAFELTARIPEIDITKIALEQKVQTVFDAKDDETLPGKITYISPLATEIDGVAYFETTVTLEGQPDWIRSGLNADIEILVDKQTNVLKLPKRFVSQGGDEASVQLRQGEDIVTQSVSIIFSGNDGFVAITGLNEGDEVVAP